MSNFRSKSLSAAAYSPLRRSSTKAIRPNRLAISRSIHVRRFEFGDDAYFEEWMMACPVESVTA